MRITIIPTKSEATTVVIFLLTNEPIKALFLVKMTSGIIGNGIKMLNST